MRKHKKKQQPNSEALPEQLLAMVERGDLVAKVNDFHPPVPVQVGDQVVTSFTPDGPIILKILRQGVQIWPELKAAS